MTTIGGRHGGVPPGDTEGFLSYAKALRTPTIYNAIKHAKPASCPKQVGMSLARADQARNSSIAVARSRCIELSFL